MIITGSPRFGAFSVSLGHIRSDAILWYVLETIEPSKYAFALDIGRRLIASLSDESAMSGEYFRSAIQQGAEISDEQTGDVIRTLVESGELEYQFGRGVLPGRKANHMNGF